MSRVSISATSYVGCITFRLDHSPTTTKTFSLSLAPRYSGVQNIIQHTKKTRSTSGPSQNANHKSVTATHTFRLDQSPTTTKNFSPPTAPRYSGVQNTIQNTKQTYIQLPIQKAIGSLRISPKFLTQQQLRIPKSTIERSWP